MKTYRVLLSCMVITLMMPAFADDTDGQHHGQGKREGNGRQQTTTATMTTKTVAQPAVVMGRSPGSFMAFKHIPVAVPNNSQNNLQGNASPRSQPQIRNEHVGNQASPVIQNPQTQTNNVQFDSRTSRDRSVQEQKRRNYYANANTGRNQIVTSGIGSDGYIRANDSNLTNRGYIRADNSNLSSDGYVRPNQNRSINNGNSQGRYIRDQNNQGWQGRDRVTTQYRMPYRQGYSDRYRVHYARDWPSNYGWRSHGWTRNYREADPYWFAVITSIALAQAWSDAEVAQAINDDNLRQQLIYDEDVRQQMIASGYPADQIDYPPDDYSNDPNGYPPSGYDNPYDMNTTYPPQNQTTYYPPPTSTNPNSPLYNGVYSGAPLSSGEQVANRNANQNALFFCNAGNKQQTVEAFRQVQSPDMNVWKTIESYNKCRVWAASP